MPANDLHSPMLPQSDHVANHDDADLDPLIDGLLGIALAATGSAAAPFDWEHVDHVEACLPAWLRVIFDALCEPKTHVRL